MERIRIEPGVVLYKQTPSASWSLDLHQLGQKRRRFSLRTTNEAKARQIARQHADALASGTWNIALSGSSLKDVVDRFLSERCEKRHSENTKAITSLVFDRLLGWCDRNRIGTIDGLNASHVERYLSEMQKIHGWAPATTNRELAWIKALARWALKRGYLRSDFTLAVERLPVPKKRKYVPSPTDLAALCRELPPHHADLVRFIFNTGGPRIGDALAVTAADVNLESREIRFNGEKTDTEFFQPLNEVALEIVRRRLLTAGGGPLFGDCGDRHNVLRRLKSASRRAKLPGIVTPHAIRRSAITENSKIYGAFAVQKMANHASITTTQSYVGQPRVIPLANAL